jgi:pyruvate formate lyase activating enzyme
LSTVQHCDVCIRECKTGNSFCQRRNEKGHLILQNSFCAFKVDTLFEKPVIHFRENVKVLSIGSWGCNLRCLGCQNVNLSWAVSCDGLGYRNMESSEIVEMAKENGCRGICYTFNEPAILKETIEDIAFEARKNGLFNVYVTNSTLTERSARQLGKYLDVVAADIKSMTDEFYYEYCGASGIPDVANKILTCIRGFSEEGCHIEVRTNIIPGGNDQEENFHGIASWIRYNLGPEVPWHITRFFPANKLKDFGQTPTRTLLKAQSIGFEEGLKFVHPFFTKGCDCAKNTFFFGKEAEHEIVSLHSCCK